MDEYKYIDLSYLEEASSDKNFLKTILSVFDEEYKELRNSLLTEMNEHASENLKKDLHKAKSSVFVTSIPGGREFLVSAEEQLKKECCNNEHFKTINDFIELCDKAIIEFNHAAKNI